MMVAVCNQKGGVGKTTVAINVAGALNAAGKDVLLVDLDPQGHATEGLGYNDAYWSEDANLFDAFTEDPTIVNDIILEHEEMDVIPSNGDMTKIESALLQERGREFKLQQIIEHVEETYDHIIFDCPPNLGTITDNAVITAGNILIPVQAERTSERALSLLYDSVIDPIEEELGGHLENGRIHEIGVVANEVQTSDNESKEMIEWFGEEFPIPRWAVMQRVALQRAWDNGVSIFNHDEDCDMQHVFEDIAREIDTGDGYAPDPVIAFASERGSVEQYVDACQGTDREPIETDGGRRLHDKQQTTLRTISGDTNE